MTRRQGWRKSRDIANTSIREALSVVAEHKAAEDAARKEVVAAARKSEDERVRLTPDDVRGARIIRDEFGWHRVVRVSAKSVTVATAYSWTERIPLDKVLEARS